MASNFKSYVTSSVGTTDTTIFTATTITTIIGLSLANVVDTVVMASAYLTKNGGGTAYIVKNAPIPNGGTMIVVGGDQKIVLQAGDIIKIKSNTAASIDVIMSILEIS